MCRMYQRPFPIIFSSCKGFKEKMRGKDMIGAVDSYVGTIYEIWKLNRYRLVKDSRQPLVCTSFTRMKGRKFILDKERIFLCVCWKSQIWAWHCTRLYEYLVPLRRTRNGIRCLGCGPIHWLAMVLDPAILDFSLGVPQGEPEYTKCCWGDRQSVGAHWWFWLWECEHTENYYWQSLGFS